MYRGVVTRSLLRRPLHAGHRVGIDRSPPVTIAGLRDKQRVRALSGKPELRCEHL